MIATLLAGTIVALALGCAQCGAGLVPAIRIARAISLTDVTAGARLDAPARDVTFGRVKPRPYAGGVRFGAVTSPTPQPAGARSTSPRVILRGDDDALAGSLALYLVEDGVIVTPDELEATHELTIAAKDGGYVVTCLGAETKGALVNAGTPALVELELRQRVASLVRTTPARAVAEGPITRIAAEIVDKRASVDERLSGRTARAFLDAGFSLAPVELADERVCVDAGATTVTIAWGPRCEGRPVGLARSDLAPRVLVHEALRLRDAAPLPTAKRIEPIVPPPPSASLSSPSAVPSPPPAGEASVRAPEKPVVKQAPVAKTKEVATPPSPPWTSPGSASRAATPLYRPAYDPVQLALRVGGVGRATAVDPRASVTAFWQWIQWAGPIASIDFSGATEPLTIGEGFAGAGAAFLWQPTAAVRTGVGLMGGAWTHGWYFAADDWGFAFDPAAIVPAWVEVRIVPGWHLSFAAEAGALGRDRIHRIQGAPVWSRGGFSLALSVGLTVDIPGPPSTLEN